MYARYRVMRLYDWIAHYAEKAWEVLQWVAILYVLYMAIAQIIVGISRDSRYRGQEEMKRENFETWKRMHATPKAHP